MAIGRVLKKNTGKKESSVNGPLKECKKLVTRWKWMTSAAWALHRKMPRGEGKKGEKESYREKEMSSDWTLERTGEAYEKAAKDEIGWLSIVLENVRKSTDFLRRVIALVAGMGGVTLSYICPHCNSCPWENYVWCVSTGHGDSRKKQHCSWCCVVCGGRYEWRAPNRMLG